jgi:hypothetical protein
MANARLHTAPARMQTILDELDRVAAEYAGAQRERSPALFAPGLTLKSRVEPRSRTLEPSLFRDLGASPRRPRGQVG